MLQYIIMIGFKINKTLRNVIIALLVIIGIFAISSLIPEKDFSRKYEGFDLTTTEDSVSATKSYSEYQNEHSSAAFPANSIAVDVLNCDTDNSYGFRTETGYYGKDVIVTDDESFVTWSVEVPEEGFYNISMEYIAIPSRNINMERTLYINGEVPFNGADNLSFYRLWRDGGPVKFDNQGNSIRPTQMEVFQYQTSLFKSNLGYEVEPYQFYFAKGLNTITLESNNEPIAISSIKLVPIQKYKTYEQYVAQQPAKPENYTGKDISIKIQGEDAVLRADPSLFARYDRSSPITEPYSVKNTVLNYIGGDTWKAPGQWIEWEAEIPEDGWYTISIKGRQLHQRGYVACRSLYIDGEIPVEEVKSIGFEYSTDWKLVTPGASKNEPYKFYFTKGKHSIRLEATLGDIGSVINELQNSISHLNLIYRTILVLTGKNPDPYRDYEIEKVYPDEVEAMMTESRRLYQLIDKFVAITGEKSDKIAPAETLAIQLETFYKHPERITKAFIAFKDNITSLGSSLLSMTETKLDIDYILIQSANDPIKPVKSGVFKKIKHEVVSFFTSFMVDSSSLGNVYDKKSDNLIEVWIVTSRDQSQILKNMIDDDFTPKTGINVNVKLIVIDSLLNAVVAGNGPDVVVTTYQSHPVDYALRNANVDLRRFADCDEVLKNFYESAYIPYEYNGGLYALPEQQTFNLMFYRKDILDEVGVEVPQTWEDLIEILPTLQGKNLDVGVPFPQIVTPDMTTFYSMIYQRGGQVYDEKGMKTVIDTEAGIGAFKYFTGLFNDYGLPVYYDFVSRFRVGEMPIGIANYTTYNTLTVSAPEIRGLWDFTFLPGTKRIDENGNEYIDRSTIAGTQCCMMIKKGKDLSDIEGQKVDDKTMKAVMKNEARMNNAWEFMKWWTSTDIQVRYGREQEALLGSSARYATANFEALRQLPWSSSQIKILEESLKDTVGVPEVPGSYYTPRHVVNAVRRIVNYQDDCRETLIEYTKKINEELERKRQEFNLPTE